MSALQKKRNQKRTKEGTSHLNQLGSEEQTHLAPCNNDWTISYSQSLSFCCCMPPNETPDRQTRRDPAQSKDFATPCYCVDKYCVRIYTLLALSFDHSLSFICFPFTSQKNKGQTAKQKPPHLCCIVYMSMCSLCTEGLDLFLSDTVVMFIVYRQSG